MKRPSRQKIADALREVLAASPQPSQPGEAVGEVVPFGRSDFLRYVLTGRVIAISRPMVEAILAELDRGGR